MAKKVHRIHSLPDDAPWAGGLPPEGSLEHPLSIRALDRVLSLQRPVVLAHLRSVRLRHPDASPAEIVRVLERRYLTAITTGGAAVGATAVVPGIGTGVTLALSGVETVGFLETTTLFAQSIAEVHGVAIDDPDRARALVLTLMLGQEGVALVSQLAGEATGRGQNRAGYWGDLVTRTIPRAALGPVVDTLKSTFVRHFATRGGASIVGKALPFGIGAAIGGTGNHLLGRRVVTTSRKAFGAPPAMLPAELEPRAGARRTEHIVGGALGRAAGGAAAITGSAVRGVSKATERLRPRREVRIRENPAPDDDSGRRP
ncbi:hypothetical protein MXD81_48250 [Microbacteriaceae bacterium K1510]|uniref:hypothetical protein n=1 Tax=Microbacterium sp. 4NA327F11 TaxID=2502229 RepID=UPI0010F6F42F|nr:hypothetical protein [Microbacterium sp. 4NA327F11]MCK9916959.1 hypothetical protein [Microbacteriaceae bacterium K1510]